MSVFKSKDIGIESLAVAPKNSTARQPGALQRAMRRAALRRNLIAYLFLLPALAGFAVFSIYPILTCFYISFTKYELITPPVWVGWANFTAVFHDTLFWTSWRNCIVYLLWSLPAFFVPIIMAIVVNELRWYWGDIFRFVYFLPAILPPIVTYLLWQWLYDPSSSGLLNSILLFLHLPKLGWLDSPQTVMPAIVLMGIWGGTGGGMLFYLAALQGIPSHLYDAAEIDGANILRRVWHITLPQLRILMMYMLLFSLMGALQLFEAPLVLTGGGPADASVTPVLQVYRYAFKNVEFGQANALSLVIFAVLLVFSLLYLQVGRRVTGLGRF